MNRLTKEQLENFRNTYDKYDGIESSEFEKICDELIEYKALEEELGISLPILFKALKNGVYIQDEGYFECPDIYFHLLIMEFVIGWANKDNIGYELLKDYGKTWWLKEDLKSE